MASKLPLTYAYPSQVKQKLAPAHEELLRHGYLANVTYDVTREGEDKVIYDFADGGAKTDGHPIADAKVASQLVLDFYARLTGQPDLAYQPAPKEEALAHDYLTTYGPERSAFIVHYAFLAAKAVDFPIQTFGGTKNFLPQALAAWEGRAEVEEAKRGAQAQIDTLRRREREEEERRRRLAEFRAALPEEALADLRHRAEEALAAEGVARARLGYEVLVKLKIDDLLEQAYVRIPASADGAQPARGGDGEALRRDPSCPDL
jgi:hypothetical protein